MEYRAGYTSYRARQRLRKVSMSAVFESRPYPLNDAIAEKLQETRSPGETALNREALEMMDDAVLVTDAAGGIRYLNPAAERLLGYRLSDVFGWSLTAVLTFRNEAVSGADGGFPNTAQPEGSEVTLIRRRGSSTRVRITDLDLPETLGAGCVLQEINE